MGLNRRAPLASDVLRAAGIKIRLLDGGIMVEMTVHGAARLARSLVKPDDLYHLSLRELIRTGKEARHYS